MPVALITGASAGLGLALTRALAGQGWTLVIDARGEDALRQAAGETGAPAIAGDIADPAHRAELAATAGTKLDLLVNNASLLGPSPQPKLGGYPLDELAAVYRVDVFAPLALSQLVLPALIAAKGTIINVSSDAAVEAYEG